MKIAKTIFFGEADKKAYVMECEANYERQLDDAVARVIAADRRMVTLSGPSCSGKTTTAKKLIRELIDFGKDVHVISIDDFYYDRALLIQRAEEEGTTLDFDSEDTIDIAELSHVVAQIMEGKPVFVPQFDFVSGKRAGGREIVQTGRDVFIFEGIQAVYPSVTELLDAEGYIGVYVRLNEDLEVDGTVYDRDELRFFRRMVRDYQFRGAAPAFTYELWQNVRKNEERLIFPNAHKCEIQLNSLMPYEVNMIAPYLCPLLAQIPEASPYAAHARELLRKLEHVTPISKSYIPKQSVYHEFLG